MRTATLPSLALLAAAAMAVVATTTLDDDYCTWRRQHFDTQDFGIDKLPLGVFLPSSTPDDMNMVGNYT